MERLGAAVWRAFADDPFVSNEDVDGLTQRIAREYAAFAPSLDAPAAPGKGFLKTRLMESHERVCACPFDGTDEGCNLTVSGTVLGAWLSASPASEDPMPLETWERIVREREAPKSDPACDDCERTHPWRDHSDPALEDPR
jgi:hypothetical protein